MTTPTAGRLRKLFVFFDLPSILKIFTVFWERNRQQNAAEGWPSREIIRIHGFPTDFEIIRLEKRSANTRILFEYSRIIVWGGGLVALWTAACAPGEQPAIVFGNRIGKFIIHAAHLTAPRAPGEQPHN